MKIVHSLFSPPRRNGMTLRNVQSIAITLFQTNMKAMVITRENPFLYLNILKEEFGIVAIAIPVKRDRKLVGYKFKNAS